MTTYAVVEADLHEPAHQRAIIDLLEEYAREVKGNGFAFSDALRQQLISGLQAHPARHVLLASDESRFVGIAVCFVGFSTFAARPVLNLHDLAVTADYRGRGVGKALLHHVEEKARQLDCCKITLEVRYDNDVAKHLYRKVGFLGSAEPNDFASTWFLEKPL